MEKAIVGRKRTASPARVYLAGLAPSGRRSMEVQLRKVAAWLGEARGRDLDVSTVPWQTLRYEHLVAIRQRAIDSGLAPASVNLLLAALRRVMREAFNLGLVDADTLARSMSVKNVKAIREPAGRCLGSGELAAIFNKLDLSRPAGKRDAALFALAYAAGLRRSELAGLTMANIQEREHDYELRLIGKGNRERRLFVNNGAGAALRDYLAIRGSEAGPLLYASRKSGELRPGQGMNEQSVYELLVRRAKAAGVELSPHDLRRSFVSDLLDGGADISTVAAMAGHSNVNTTARYDRRGDAAKERAASVLHVPYRQAKPARDSKRKKGR
jgi:site-specific recombinase XerD